jgi:formate/nitrite transporter FocA (FNT family)
MVDAGESKIFMSTKDTLIRAFMAGATLALAAAFAVTINVQTGQPLAGAVLFPVGFVMLYLFGFDLLTGVFVLAPLAVWDKRPGCTWAGVLRNWGLVFTGNFAGALVTAVMMAIYFTYGFSTEPSAVGEKLASIGVDRTLGYAKYGLAGWMTIFVRGMLCNWMVSAASSGDDLDPGQRQGDRHVDADHAVLLHGLRAFDREHVPVPDRADDGRRLSRSPTTSSGTRSRPCSATSSAG